MNTPVVKVFTGIRRCGKSVMMELVQAELRKQGVDDSRILFLNFKSGSDPRVRTRESVLAAVNEKNAGEGSGRLYLFFDEIQELAGWETLVNSVLVDTDADIYITGSNALMLSGELATYLAGRYVELRLYPFSFAEVLALLQERNVANTVAEAFNVYLVRGGFPFLYNYAFSEADASQYINDIFDSIILKDIAQRNNVRDIAQLRQLVLYFIANTGNTFFAASLVKYLKNQRRTISTETIYNYIEYCRSACLLHLVQRQDLAGKALLATQEKIYLADHGIRQALYGNNLRDINQVLENIVYMELLRRGYEVTVGKSKKAEVDFAQPGRPLQSMCRSVIFLPLTKRWNVNSACWKRYPTTTRNTYFPSTKSTAAAMESSTKISATFYWTTAGDDTIVIGDDTWNLTS